MRCEHLLSVLDVGDGHGDLTRHKDLAAARGLVVEQDAAAGSTPCRSALLIIIRAAMQVSRGPDDRLPQLHVHAAVLACLLQGAEEATEAQITYMQHCAHLHQIKLTS